MARRRFKPDPDFELVMSQAASGLEATGRGSLNRRRVTLEFVAQEIIKEAQREVDQLPPEGLPGYIKGGRRNFNSDFRRRESEPGGGKPGATYRSSFGYRVERQRGRLVFVVFNNHPHAQEVESGRGDIVRKKGDGYFAIPITKRKYAQLIKKGAVLSTVQKARARDRSALSYWRKRSKELDKQRASLRRLGSRRNANPNTRARLTREQLLRRAASFSRSRSRADRAIQSLEGSLGEAKQPHSFPVMAPNGKTYLYTKSFRTYGGYGILRRATATITRRYLRP